MRVYTTQYLESIGEIDSFDEKSISDLLINKGLSDKGIQCFLKNDIVFIVPTKIILNPIESEESINQKLESVPMKLIEVKDEKNT